MKTIIAAIHGIMTSQTDPSWPDKFDAWMLQRDPDVKVLKKKYAAGPFPRWNCWVKDPALARGLANELELFFQQTTPAPAPSPGGEGRGEGGTASTLDSGLRTLDYPSVWFLAHSNGAVIALLAAKILIERGYKIGGLILTGAAVEADVERNGVMEWWRNGMLREAIAYSSQDDEVLDGDPREVRSSSFSLFSKLHSWAWGKVMFPYGCLGRVGWFWQGQPLPNPLLRNSTTPSPQSVFTRWFPGGHSTYFTPGNIEGTFEQIYQDVCGAAQV